MPATNCWRHGNISIISTGNIRPGSSVGRMEMSTTIAGSPLPDKLPHIFFEVALEVLPELNYDDLVYLSLLVRSQQREPVYSALVDAVRKVQWMKLSSMDATGLDAVLVAQYDGSVDVVLNDPVGKIRHAKALLELVSHGKAALDSLAVFLNDLLGLGYSGGDRDFRRDAFKKKLASSHATLEAFLRAESHWLQLNNTASTSIVSARDEWLHRGFPDVAFMWPPTEVGVLPIPKVLTASVTTTATRATHHSTPEFGEYHFSRIIRLLEIVISLAIDIEAGGILSPPPRSPSGQVRISVVKFCLTRQIAVREPARQLKLGPFSVSRQ
jgi:hypothetical protein